MVDNCSYNARHPSWNTLLLITKPRDISIYESTDRDIATKLRDATKYNDFIRQKAYKNKALRKLSIFSIGNS